MLREGLDGCGPAPQIEHQRKVLILRFRLDGHQTRRVTLHLLRKHFRYILFHPA